MEPFQPHLFQPDNVTSNINDTFNNTHSTNDAHNGDINEPILSDPDRHMVDITANYIQRLPDNMTRKHIARILINTIIKSANL